MQRKRRSAQQERQELRRSENRFMRKNRSRVFLQGDNEKTERGRPTCRNLDLMEER
jgi:hypothetical protein